MKNYEVVLYETRRYVIVVEAESEEQAVSTADLIDDMDEWDEDFEFYVGEIDHVREVKDGEI